MLEILALIWMCRSIGTKLERKGYTKRWPYQLLLVVLWFTGEVIGAIIGGVIGFLQGMTEDGAFMVAWVIGILGAVVGAVIVFAIVGGLPPAEVEDEFALPAGDYAAPFRPSTAAREDEEPREDITRAPRDVDPDGRVRT